jgi:hypothetical protein
MKPTMNAGRINSRKAHQIEDEQHHLKKTAAKMIGLMRPRTTPTAIGTSMNNANVAAICPAGWSPVTM